MRRKKKFNSSRYEKRSIFVESYEKVQKGWVKMVQFLESFLKRFNSKTFFFNMTQRKFLFKYLTQRTMILFFLWNNDPKNRTYFFEETYDSKNSTFLPIWLTPRIQAFWTFSYDSQNWTLFLEYDSKIWTCFKMTQRIEPCLKMTQRIEPFSSKWLKKFVLWIRLRIDFFDYDSENGIVLCTLTFIIEPFW